MALTHEGRPCAPLVARDLPDWFIGTFLRWVRACGLSVSLSCAAVLTFSDHPGNVPAVFMWSAVVMFAWSFRPGDDGMMVIRGLGLFAVGAFVRAFVQVVFMGGYAPVTMELLQLIMWLHLTLFSVLLIRLLILWGVVVRNSAHRW